MDLHRTLRDARRHQGLTQADLARRAQVSLPTVQNLEGGRANPSRSTLGRVLDALGLRLRVEDRPADWAALAACGAPLTIHDPAPDPGGPARSSAVVPFRATPERLLRNLRDAARELAAEHPGAEGQERKREAVQALLIALREHFPDFFREHLAGKRLYEDLIREDVDGRIVKGVREAVPVLARYL
ncbi:MAG TPA: helix-turn-helix domain-containing protein [Longimicrobiales bacterium]|jgi:HTH-type transcriptional regulator/antitoxin HipB